MIPASVSSPAKFVFTLLSILNLHLILTFGSYSFSCAGKNGAEVKYGWGSVWIVLIVLGLVGGGGYLVYKQRLRVS